MNRFKKKFLEANAKAIQRIPPGSLKKDTWTYSVEKELHILLSNLHID
jgi:hypothetical protein